MSPSVQAGTILIEEQPLMAQALGLLSEPYFGDWSVVKNFDSFTLDRKIHAAGWNFFYMAAEVKAVFFGALGAQKIQNALKRILAKVSRQNYNGLEVTGIVARHFLGVPYAVVSAHSRHIQQGPNLDGPEERRTSHHDAKWARG
jgi:hypothetical protein